MYNSSHVLIVVNIITQSVAVWFCHKGRLTDLHWVRELTFLMHLGNIEGPFVPHNIISTQESPVPLPKTQTAFRFKILMSSVSKKEPSNTILLTQKSQQANPSRFPNGAHTEKDTGLQGIFKSLLICLSLRVSGKGAPSTFPNRVPMDRGTPSTETLIYLFFHSFIHTRTSAGVPKTEPSYIWGKK